MVVQTVLILPCVHDAQSNKEKTLKNYKGPIKNFPEIFEKYFLKLHANYTVISVSGYNLQLDYIVLPVLKELQFNRSVETIKMQQLI